MKNTYTYPAIFHSVESGWRVEFPDLPGCTTQAVDEPTASTKAEHSLLICLSHMEKAERPTPSSSKEVAQSPLLISYQDYVSPVTVTIDDCD